MNNLTIYGIKACDTMKKAFTWLDEHSKEYTFHDYKKLGIDEAKLDDWLALVDWSELINRRGTTWRKLDDSDKENIDNDKAKRLILSNQSLIKRPLLEKDGRIYLGFKPELYDEVFS